MEQNKKDELLDHLVAINQLRKQIIEMMALITKTMQDIDNHYNRITMELMKE